MKQCLNCNQTYTDDLLFCLSDGTPLTDLLDDNEQQTVIRNVPANAALKAPDNSGRLFKYISAALAVLLVMVLLIGAAAFLILWSGSSSSSNVPPRNEAVVTNSTPIKTINTPDLVNTDQSALKDKEEELERERRRLADERKKLEADKRLQNETIEPDQPRFTDQGTARITFRRGSVGESVSGTVGRSRSYVLRTVAGQYLSASVRSAGGCVVFSGGSASTGFTTGNGDARLTVENTCNTPSNFSMSVTVR